MTFLAKTVIIQSEWFQIVDASNALRHGPKETGNGLMATQDRIAPPTLGKQRWHLPSIMQLIEMQGMRPVALGMQPTLRRVARASRVTGSEIQTPVTTIILHTFLKPWKRLEDAGLERTMRKARIPRLT